MNGYYLPGFDEFYSPQGVVGSHGKIISDGQDSQVDTFFADELHVVEQPGVAGVIYFFVVDVEQKSAGIAAVGAIRQHGAVLGDGQFNPAPGIIKPAADVLGMDVLNSLARH